MTRERKKATPDQRAAKSAYDKAYRAAGRRKNDDWRFRCKEKLAQYNAEKYREAREWVDGLKKSRGCYICGESRPPCLDFHHRDPATKLFNVGKGMRKNRHILEAEIEKCVVVCSNCHRVLTWTPVEVKSSQSHALGLS